MNGANLHIAYRCFCTSSRQCLSPSHLQEPGEAVVSGTSSKSRQPHKRRRLKRAAKVEQPNDEEAAELMDDSADVFGGDERLLESAGDSLRQLSKTGRNTDSPDEVEDEESLFSEESEATDQLDDSTSATEDEETSVKASPWEVVESSKLITYLHPEIAAEYDVQANKNLAEPLEVLTTHCPSVVWWKCGTCQHSWKSAVFVRCLLKTECPKCKALKYPSVALARPALALCWDAERNDPFISLETLSIESKEKTFWRCPSCKNPYVARVKDQCRSNAIFCPHCGKTLLGDERRVRKVKVKKAKRMPKAERALVKKMKLRSLRKHPDPATEERIAAAVQKVYNIRRAQRLLTMQGGSEFKGDAQHATMPSYTE